MKWIPNPWYWASSVQFDREVNKDLHEVLADFMLLTGLGPGDTFLAYYLSSPTPIELRIQVQGGLPGIVDTNPRRGYVHGTYPLYNINSFYIPDDGTPSPLAPAANT